MYLVTGKLFYKCAGTTEWIELAATENTAEKALYRCACELLQEMAERTAKLANQFIRSCEITFQIVDQQASHPDTEVWVTKPFKWTKKKPAMKPGKGSRFTNGKGTD